MTGWKINFLNVNKMIHTIITCVLSQLQNEGKIYVIHMQSVHNFWMLLVNCFRHDIKITTQRHCLFNNYTLFVS